MDKTLSAAGFASPAPTAPEELDGLVKQQMAIVAKLAKAAGLKPE